MRLLFSTLMRLLFPTWAFFDASGAPPSLEVRRHSPTDDTGAWMPVVIAAPRRWWHLFYNPAGTYTLAAQTLVERLYAELREPAADAAVQAARVAQSEVLVTHLAESMVLPSWRVPAGWQWRIVVRDGADDAEWYLGPVQS